MAAAEEALEVLFSILEPLPAANEVPAAQLDATPENEPIPARRAFFQGLAGRRP
jgi:hypothetical protein